MINTPVRLVMAAVLAAVMCWGTHAVRQGLKPPSVAFPDRDFQQLPLQFTQFGTWRGEVVKLDPKIFLATEAKTVVDRLYRDQNKQAVSLHVALFADPDRGVYHSPVNCYRSAGWEKLKEVQTFRIPTGADAGINADLSSWEKDDGRHILVAYWFELDDHVLYDRLDLPKVRFAMRGKQVWPAMIKVLMETAATDSPEQDELRLRQLGASVYAWIHQTDHEASLPEKSP